MDQYTVNLCLTRGSGQSTLPKKGWNRMEQAGPQITTLVLRGVSPSVRRAGLPQIGGGSADYYEI